MRWTADLPVAAERTLVIIDGAWAGRVPETGEYLTDGALMFRADSIHSLELRGVLESTERFMGPQKDRRATAAMIWGSAVAGATRAVTFRGRGPHEELTDAVHLVIDEDGTPLVLDPRKLALALEAIGPIDEIRAATSTGGAVLYRDDVPRAVIMPRRP